MAPTLVREEDVLGVGVFADAAVLDDGAQGDWVDRRLDAVERSSPGSTTLALLEDLAAAPSNPYQRVRLAAAWQRQLAAAQAAALSADLAATTPPTTSDERLGGTPRVLLDHETLTHELALASSRSARELAGDVALAEELCRYPAMASLLDRGRVSMRHLRAVIDAGAELPADMARQLDAEVAPRATGMTAASLRRLAAQVATRLVVEARRADLADSFAGKDGDALDDAARAHRDAQAAARAAELDARRLAQIGVSSWAVGLGLSKVQLTLSSIDAAVVLQLIGARAARLAVTDDPRTRGEREIEAVLAALRGALDRRDGGRGRDGHLGRGEDPGRDGHLGTAAASGQQPSTAPGAGDIAVRINATVDLATLLGVRDGIALLDGLTPVPADQLRRLVAQSGSVTLRRLVYDDVGHLLDLSLDRYLVDGPLRRLITARDLTCRWPGCARPAKGADVDHGVDFADGGASDCANCLTLCRRHHNCKTHRGFTYRRPDPATGEAAVTTPLGASYRQDATTYSSDGTDTGAHGRVDPDPPPF